MRCHRQSRSQRQKQTIERIPCRRNFASRYSRLSRANAPKMKIADRPFPYPGRKRPREGPSSGLSIANRLRQRRAGHQKRRERKRRDDLGQKNDVAGADNTRHFLPPSGISLMAKKARARARRRAPANKPGGTNDRTRNPPRSRAQNGGLSANVVQPIDIVAEMDEAIGRRPSRHINPDDGHRLGQARLVALA